MGFRGSRVQIPPSRWMSETSRSIGREVFCGSRVELRPLGGLAPLAAQRAAGGRAFSTYEALANRIATEFMQ